MSWKWNETYIGEVEILQIVNAVQKQDGKYYLHPGIARSSGSTRMLKKQNTRVCTEFTLLPRDTRQQQVMEGPTLKVQIQYEVRNFFINRKSQFIKQQLASERQMQFKYTINCIPHSLMLNTENKHQNITCHSVQKLDLSI